MRTPLSCPRDDDRSRRACDAIDQIVTSVPHVLVFKLTVEHGPLTTSDLNILFREAAPAGTPYSAGTTGVMSRDSGYLEQLEAAGWLRQLGKGPSKRIKSQATLWDITGEIGGAIGSRRPSDEQPAKGRKGKKGKGRTLPAVPSTVSLPDPLMLRRWADEIERITAIVARFGVQPMPSLNSKLCALLRDLATSSLST